jgi:hypothetical protein
MPTVAATVINFEEFAGRTLNGAISNGYAGLNWSTWLYMDSSSRDFDSSAGFDEGAVSRPVVAYNTLGNPATFSSPNPARTFALVSLSLTAFCTDHRVTFTGTVSGTATPLVQVVDNLLLATPVVVNFDGWKSLTSVRVESVVLRASGRHVAIDNLTIVPGM